MTGTGHIAISGAGTQLPPRFRAARVESPDNAADLAADLGGKADRQAPRRQQPERRNPSHSDTVQAAPLHDGRPMSSAFAAQAIGQVLARVPDARAAQAYRARRLPTAIILDRRF